MPLTINTTNSFSFAINKSQDETQTALQRLASGRRINSAKDGAAALFTIQQQTADIRGISQSIRNAGDGISLAQTAQGALGQVNTNLQRIRELTVQASNATVGDPRGIQAEIDQLTQENSRIAETTSFNGQSLFSNASLNFQLGEDGNSASQVNANLSSLEGLNSIDPDLAATGTVDVSTPAAAQASLAQLDEDIAAISSQASTFGALEQRFSVSTSNLENRSENLQAARSRIEDADFALESARNTRAQLLLQAGIGAAAQSNISKQAVLSLLG